MKLLLLPLAMLYGAVVRLRNLLFDLGVFQSHSFGIPVLAIGNLRVGGTGKTPTTEWVVDRFKSTHRLAVLSRGYGRVTKGWRVLSGKDTASEVGDEPALIKYLHPDVTVAVMEDRVEGVRKLKQVENPQLVILDDAMQHRHIRPGHLMLLTSYHDLFTRDHLLPAGRLREHRSQYKRADTIVVTKCPPTLNPQQRKALREEILPKSHQQLFFASESYPGWYDFHRPKQTGLWSELSQKKVLLVTGLADSTTLLRFLDGAIVRHSELSFPDHHDYSDHDLDKITDAYHAQPDYEAILTTEKDAQRMNKWKQNEKFASLPVRVIRHQIQWIGNDAKQVEERIHGFIKSY